MFEIEAMGLALLNRTGHVLRVNTALRTLAEEAGASFAPDPLMLFAPADRDTLGRDIAATLAGLDAASRGRRRATLQGAAPRRVEIGLSPVREADGVISGLILSLIDLTAIQGSEDEVAHSRRLQAVGLLAGGIAHDFNNLLTAIGGAAEAASEAEGREAALADIRDTVVRGAALVRQLLAFARQQTLQPEIIAVNDDIRGIAAILSRLLRKNIELTLDLEEPGRYIRVDRSQLDQVLINLAVNARDAMPDGGRLTLASGHLTLLTPKTIGAETIPPGRYVTLTIADTGHGIPKDQIEQIFEPFFTTKTAAGGSGLGLATVLGVVRQSGGFLIVESAPGVGTKVHIHFPRVAAPESGARAPEPVREQAPVRDMGHETGPARTPQARILLVEDEDPVRRLAERALCRRGFLVEAAPSAEAALALVDAGLTPDLVVSDVMMPGMDGPSLLAILRERWPDLPAILVSGYAAPGPRTALAKETAIFLAKPYTLADLAETAARCLGQKIDA